MQWLLKHMLVAALAWLVLSRSLFAGYIDPNSGGLLFQILAVLFAFLSGSVLLFASKLRMGWARLKRLWRERGSP